MKKSLFCLLLAALVFVGAALAEGADAGGVAGASDMTDVIDVVEPGMTPVTAEALNDGVYAVSVDSSSAMFVILDCELRVADGAMTAKLTMKSDAYSHMYPGPAEEAAAADADALIALEATADGEFTFTLPVAALDAGCECAAFSVRKQLWYPRTLLFRADSLPAEAWKAEAVTVRTLGLADGEYLCDVALTGGGRATLASPARLTVLGGACTAVIEFSTAKIGYVIVDGVQYEPLSTEGGAAFEVPVAAFDRGLSIVVQSTALSPAVEVDYTMTFDSASLAGA